MERKRNLYFVMEYCNNGELFDYIVSKKRLKEPEACTFFQQIINGVYYLHKQGIIHRDLKPENLVFGGDGYLHLTDFGIAMEYHRGEKGVVSASGTPGYMAPEAIINKPHDFAADYFALGVIVYELMIGERPYQGANRKEIKEKEMKGY